MAQSWRERATTVFHCEKQPAVGSRGMVVSNHPLASAAGAEMLAAGGNAIDAAVATLFCLTVVEPMMIGIVGGGTAHIRTPDGQHRIIDAMSTVPLAGRADMFTPVPNGAPENFQTVGRENVLGVKAIAAAGSVRGWCEMLRRWGSFSLDDVMQPAIRHASRGFRATPYLHECITNAAADLAQQKEIAAMLLPGGAPLKAGSLLVQGDYAETLRLIAKDGEGALHGGPIGDAVAAYVQAHGGILSREDFSAYRHRERAPIRGNYRGWEIIAPPPPAASGVHMTQMLNILEAFDVRAMGFGSPDLVHLMAEALKIAFADRAEASGDPDFVAVPVARLTSKDYAAERRARIDMAHTQSWGPGIRQGEDGQGQDGGIGMAAGEGANTTHMTAADRDGNVAACTFTINNTFGARVVIPGTGIIPNNYMDTFDPRPGRALSIAPGKRVTTSMAPTMALHEGRLKFALGLPGGKRIFPSVWQAIINVIDHGMSLQEAVEAPRQWSEGPTLEMENTYPEAIYGQMRARGHKVEVLPHVAGGMNAIGFNDDGTMTGAACWRADGHPVGVSGGLSRRGARFWPGNPRE